MRIFLIIITFVLLLTSCDTILNRDDELGPEINLIKQYQDDEWLFFTLEMHNINNINSFALEVVFDSDIFDISGNQELYEDNNENGIFDYGDQFLDCGTDGCCDGDDSCEDDLDDNYDPGTCTDEYGDQISSQEVCESDSVNGIWTENLAGTEGNGNWDDLTVLLYDGFRQYNAIMEASGYSPNFNFLHISEYNKISITGGLVDMGDGGQTEFLELDSPICLIAFRILSETPTEIMIDEWKLKDGGGYDLYYGYQVHTDTLLIDFSD